MDVRVDSYNQALSCTPQYYIHRQTWHYKVYPYVQLNDSAFTHPNSNSVSVNLWTGTNVDVRIQFDPKIHLETHMEETITHSEIGLHRFRLIADSLYLLQSCCNPNKLLNSHHEVNVCIMHYYYNPKFHTVLKLSITLFLVPKYHMRVIW
jgi:hypothetical protein